MVEQRIRLEPTIHSPREARRFVDRALRGWGGPDQRDYAVLLVNELVTNVIRHAHTPMEVRVATDPGAIEITVHDEDSRWPRLRQAKPLAEDGRGLLTVAALADAWGVEPEANGKTVWCRIAAKPSAR